MEEHNKMIYDIDKGITKSENPKYQPNFDCIRTIGPLFLDEQNIKEFDKDLEKKELKLSTFINKSGISECEIMEAVSNHLNDEKNRNTRYNILKEQIENESKKYYNEVEII